MDKVDIAINKPMLDFFGNDKSVKKSESPIVEDKSKTVILVTHSMASVRKYCNKAILIRDGIIEIDGSPEDVANAYSLENVESMQNSQNDKDEKTQKSPHITDFSAKLLSVWNFVFTFWAFHDVPPYIINNISSCFQFLQRKCLWLAARSIT